MTVAEGENDKGVDLFAVRSVLFLPASNPRAIAKAREAGADLVVLDLEDAVKPSDKREAREAAVEAVAKAWPMSVAIRVNGVGTDWHSLDLDAAARSRADLVVVPRAISAHLVHGVAEAVSVAQEKLRLARLRKFRRATEAAVLWIIHFLKRHARRADQLGIQRLN